MARNTKYDARIEERLLRQFLERRVAGLILTGFSIENDHMIPELIEAGLPTVVIWEKTGGPPGQLCGNR